MTVEDLEVLDCLCARRATGVVYKAVRRGLDQGTRGALKRLRHRGLVALDSYRPSASAMLKWRERHSWQDRWRQDHERAFTVAKAISPSLFSAAAAEEDHSLSPDSEAAEAVAEEAVSRPAEPATAVPSAPVEIRSRRPRELTPRLGRFLALIEEIAGRCEAIPANAKLAETMGWGAANHAATAVTDLISLGLISVERQGNRRRISSVRSGKSTL